MYATGGNPEVARLVGINTTRYKIGAFMTVGVLSAIAGMFVMADLSSGTTSIGSGWELTVIAGVVVGGVSLFGGAGTVAGGVVGILMLKVVQSGLVVIGAARVLGREIDAQTHAQLLDQLANEVGKG